MISINALTKEFSTRPLFDNISFVINRRDKIALTGKNGAGKSTLLKMIAGLESPTSGAIAIPRGVTVGYLPQHITTSDTVSLREEVSKAFDDRRAIIERAEKLNQEMAERTDYESDDYQQLIMRAADANDQAQMLASENFEAEMEKTLFGLGFERTDLDRPTAEFSGGWRMRIELAKILLKNPDLLLLDEPTNHLDIVSIQWLEKFLSEKARAVMLVSHDKAFIDRVTKRTIEISLGKVYDYNVNYSKYLILREERLEQQQRAYENQQKQIADTEKFIERFRYKATKAVQVQSRMKQLAKIVPIEIDEIDRSHISLRFQPAPRSGDYPVIAEDLGLAFGDHQVFDHATFTIRRGQKVAFVGKNGQGKSTMVKCITGDLDHYSGTLKLGHNVTIGYFAQNQATLLDPKLTVFETIDRIATGDMRTKVRDLLGAFMFGGEDVDKPVAVLSGGERTRLAMISLLLQPVNLLILDEPTNHLDIPSKEVLKKALQAYNGTLIVVSNDRDFLDGLAEQIYNFSDGKVSHYMGGIYEFLESNRLESLADLETVSLRRQPAKSDDKALNQQPAGQPQKAPDKAKTETNAPESKEAPKFINYAEKRMRDKALKRLRANVEKAEAQVAECEKTIAEIEAKMAQGDGSPEILARHAEATKALENAMSMWELAESELENA